MKIAAVLLSVAVCGCANSMGSVSLASTTPLAGEYRIVARGVQAEACMSSLLIIPLGLTIPDLGNVVEDATRKARGANALANAEVYEKSFISILYNRICYGVRGDAVKVLGSGALSENPNAPR